jgi:hypothetical protein
MFAIMVLDSFGTTTLKADGAFGMFGVPDCNPLIGFTNPAGRCFLHFLVLG